MNAILAWLSAGTSWAGPDGIWARVGEHSVLSTLTVAIAAAIAIPLGLWVGHTGHARFLVVNAVNGFRALPTLGLLDAAILIVSPHLPGSIAFQVPAILVLVVLAAPPLLAGAYAGVDAVDAATRDAAQGMGMRGAQVLWRVEVPCAMPLIWAGLRSAFLQVVATATVAATVGIGGLGRFLIDGLAVADYGQMGGGAVLVAALAISLDVVLSVLGRRLISPGLSGHR